MPTERLVRPILPADGTVQGGFAPWRSYGAGLMRRSLFLLLAVACSSLPTVESGAPTTSGPEPPTATAPPTTGLAETTTPPGECTAAETGSHSFTEQGFVCPPDLLPLAQSFSSYLAGTYRTRIFEPAFEFTNSDRFVSLGESSFMVGMHYQSSNIGLIGYNSVPSL